MLSRITAVAAIIFAFSAIWSTQITAGWFGHDPRLGGFAILPGAHKQLYMPWQIYQWAWSAKAWPNELLIGLAWNTSSTALAITLAIYSAYLRIFGGPSKFGKSGWATMADAIKAKLIAGKGGEPKESLETRVFGEFEGKIITVTDERNGLIFGPPGSGKTRSFFIPTMLEWKSSVIVFASGAQDIWEATAGWRSTFSDVFFLDLGNSHGHRYNPLSEIRIGTDYEIRDATIMAELFPPQSPEEAKVPWWPLGGARLMTAIILHICYTKTGGKRNLGEARKFVALPNETIIQELCSSPSEFAMETGNWLVGQKEFIDSVRSYLNPWASPILAKVTSESDFRASDLVGRNRPVSLYIRVPSDESSSLMDALRVIISTLMRAMLHDERKTSDGRVKKHKLLCAFDEFHRFKVRDFDGIIQEGRKFGLRFLLGTPSEKSLFVAYGRNQAITESCHVQVFMATGDPDTQRRISMSIGKTTEFRTHQSRATEADELFSRFTKSTVESTREIVDPGAVRAMSDNEAFVLLNNVKAMKVRKLIDFDKRDRFKSKLLPAPERTIERKIAAPEKKSALIGASI